MTRGGLGGACQVLGQRHKDIKNGLSAPPRPTVQSALQLLARPWWCLDMLRARRLTFGNIVGHARSVTNMASLSAWTAEQFDPSLSWRDVAWIKERWGGKCACPAHPPPARIVAGTTLLHADREG